MINPLAFTVEAQSSVLLTVSVFTLTGLNLSSLWIKMVLTLGQRGPPDALTPALSFLNDW